MNRKRIDEIEFRELASDTKLILVFIVADCSPAGIWRVDLKAARWHMGMLYDEGGSDEDILASLSPWVQDLGGGVWWYKFAVADFGKLSMNRSAHQIIIAELVEHSLLQDDMLKRGRAQKQQQPPLPAPLPKPKPEVKPKPHPKPQPKKTEPKKVEPEKEEPKPPPAPKVDPAQKDMLPAEFQPPPPEIKLKPSEIPPKMIADFPLAIRELVYWWTDNLCKISSQSDPTISGQAPRNIARILSWKKDDGESQYELADLKLAAQRYYDECVYNNVSDDRIKFCSNFFGVKENFPWRDKISAGYKPPEERTQRAQAAMNARAEAADQTPLSDEDIYGDDDD